MFAQKQVLPNWSGSFLATPACLMTGNTETTPESLEFTITLVELGATVSESRRTRKLDLTARRERVAPREQLYFCLQFRLDCRYTRSFMGVYAYSFTGFRFWYWPKSCRVVSAYTLIQFRFLTKGPPGSGGPFGFLRRFLFL